MPHTDPWRMGWGASEVACGQMLTTWPAVQGQGQQGPEQQAREEGAPRGGGCTSGPQAPEETLWGRKSLSYGWWSVKANWPFLP